MASSPTRTSSGITLTSPLYSNLVTVTSGVAISRPIAGIYADSSHTWSISSAGTISGTLSAGVLLRLGGEVIDDPGGAATAAITGTTGISIAGAAGAVTNYATITGTAGSGVYLGDGSVVTNGTNGLISGVSANVGVALMNGATVANTQTDASITGVMGTMSYPI